MTRRIVKTDDGHEMRTSASVRECNHYCPLCKRKCCGIADHNASGEIMAHQCERHWWLDFIVSYNRRVRMVGFHDEEKKDNGGIP
jgi:hypothetical protein